MTDWIHKYFRDRVVGIMLMVSCILIAVIGVGSFKLIAAITQDEKEWYFGTEKEYKVYAAGTTSETYTLKKSVLENIFATDDEVIVQLPYSLMISNTLDQHPAMVMADTKQIEMQFTMDGETQKDGCVYLGEDILDATYFIENNRYINIDGADFSVAGILKNTSLGSDDERIVIAYKHLSDKAKNIIDDNATMRGELWLRIPGKQQNSVYENILKNCKMVWTEYHPPSDYYSKNADEYLLNILKPAVLIFCIIDLAIALSMWLKSQKDVIHILKCNGASRDDLYIKLGATFLKCVFPAVITGIIMWFI